MEGLLLFLSGLFKWISSLSLIQAGENSASGKAAKEVLQDVQKAQDATRIPDTVRDERLRNKYDRSRNK